MCNFATSAAKINCEHSETTRSHLSKHVIVMFECGLPLFLTFVHAVNLTVITSLVFVLKDYYN